MEVERSFCTSKIVREGSVIALIENIYDIRFIVLIVTYI